MATLVTADLQSIAQIVYKTPGTVWFVALTGNDSNDGKSWATAKLSPKTTIEGAAAGDVVLLAAGVYALGANYINTPDGVSVRARGCTRRSSRPRSIGPGPETKSAPFACRAMPSCATSRSPMRACGRF